VIECLRSLDVVLVCCEVEGAEIVARWVQLNPAVYPAILGSTVELIQPKAENPLTFTVQIPADITEVHTDVRFPIVAPIPMDS
jgi:hypothetical protein